MRQREKDEQLTEARPKGTGKKLNESINKRLAAYALAATAAAGIGLMGGATPAEANNIITGSPNLTISSTSTPVDLSVEGMNILQFMEGAPGFVSSHGLHSANGIFVLGLSGTHKGVSFQGEFLVTPTIFPAVLGRGARIGTSGQVSDSLFMATINSRADTMGGRTSGGGIAPWNGKTGFLGFKISKNSASYFGWAKMSFSSKGDVAHVTEYGLDTVPGQVIDAGQTSTVPEPGTLALLALGAAGLLALRRRWSATTHPPSTDI